MKASAFELFYKKVAGPQDCNFNKNKLQQRCFPVKFANILWIRFLQKSPMATSDSFRFPACNFN